MRSVIVVRFAGSTVSGAGGLTVGSVALVRTANAVLRSEMLPAPSKALIRYECAVSGVRPVSYHEVEPTVARTAPSREMTYPAVTEVDGLSIEAAQVRSIRVSDWNVEVTPEGTEGASVSAAML